MLIEKQKNQLRGQLLHDYALASHTSWRVGGKAKQVYIPHDLNDLGCFLAQLPMEEPIYFLGLGSNVLIRDGGLAGTVILTLEGLSNISLVTNNIIRVEAGVPCPKVAKFCVKHDFVGAEFLAGIPGTMGGALEMNAGAFGGETWDIVEKVELMKRDGSIYLQDKSAFEINYRHISGRADAEWFMAAHIKLENGQPGDGKEKIKTLLAQRKYAQPIGQFSCGSVFKNPKPHFAAQLIEQAGLKGLRYGGAYVSEKHANFIINDGSATATEIEQLIQHIQQVIQSANDIELIPEVRIVGQTVQGAREVKHG